MKADLLVSSGFTSNSLLLYDGVTGAFLKPAAVAAGGGLEGPAGLAYGPDGNLYLANSIAGGVLRYSGVTGAFLDTFVPPGSGGLIAPHGLAFSPDGHLYVGSAGTGAVLRYQGGTGAFLGTFVAPGSGGLNGVFGSLTFGPDGHLYVASYFTNNVLRYSGATGSFLGVFAAGPGLVRPTGLIFGPDGNLYVASSGASSIVAFSPSGKLLKTFVAAGSGGLTGPFGLIFGPDQNLYVTCLGDNSVRRYHGATGAFLDTFVPPGSGNLIRPTFLHFTQHPQAVVRPDGLTFGPQLATGMSPSQTVILTNEGSGSLAVRRVTLTGADPADFVITADDCSGATLAPGGNCTVNVSFVPRSAGPHSAVLSFDDNAADSPQTVSLSGTGTAPAIACAPTALEFGEQVLGSSKPARVVSLTNSGTGPLVFGRISLTGQDAGDFTLASDTCSGAALAPGSSCNLKVRFSPTAAGKREAALSIVHSGSDSPHQVPLSGTGAAPAVNLNPAGLDFGEQLLGTSSAAQTITLANAGPIPLAIADVRLSGDHPEDFLVTADSCLGNTILPGRRCTIAVSFAPKGPGRRRAVLTAVDSTGDRPQSAALQGDGAAPADLSLQVTADRDRVVAGGEVEYTLAVLNEGPGEAEQVLVTVTLPDGAVYVRASASQGTWNAPQERTSGTVTCKVGRLAKGTDATLTLVVMVTTGAGHTMTSVASATSATPDLNTANNWAKVTTEVHTRAPAGGPRPLAGRPRSRARHRSRRG